MTNPLAGSAEAVAEGEKLYEARCAACHGRNARGAEGPNLYHSHVVNGADERFFEVVRRGIPGTEMAPLPLEDEQIWRIVSFVHSLTKPGTGPRVRGDADAGRRLFYASGCARCHITEGKGGVLGPDLSSVAAQLSSARIREAVLNPGTGEEGFRAAVVKTRSGRVMEGVLKNQDNFSVQIMSLDGDLIPIARSDIASFQLKAGSLMPSDAARRLTDEELQNLLAFLDRQRAPFLRHDIGFQTY